MIRSLFLFGAVLVSVGLTACQGEQGNGAITASGTIECTTVNLAAKVPGIIRELSPREGQRLDTTDVVALIGHSELDHKLDQARAGVDLAEAQLRLALNGARSEDLDRARAVVRQAEVRVDGARTNYRRIQQLAEGGAATEKQLDDARTALDAAEAGLEIARASLRAMEAGARSEEISAARARLAQARAGVRALEQRIDDCTVRAPVAGTVTHRLAEPGEMASPGTGLVTVSILDEVWVKVYLTEVEIGLIRLGQPVDVYLDAAPDSPHAGTVTYISPTAEFTPKNVQTKEDRVKLVFGVRVTVENVDGALKPGLPADAVFVNGHLAEREG